MTFNFLILILIQECTFFKECLQHHGHKGNAIVALKNCGAIDERALISLMWIRILGIDNAFYL